MYFLMRKSKPISLLIAGYSYRKVFAPSGNSQVNDKWQPCAVAGHCTVERTMDAVESKQSV